MVLAQIQKYRSMEQDRNPKISPHTYRHPNYDKGGKNIQWRKDSLFKKWRWKNWAVTGKLMKLEHALISYTKMNSKWIKDLNVRLNTIKLLQANIGSTLVDINYRKIHSSF